MLVSLKEIRKYVDLVGISDQEIADRLTFAGIEVEEIKRLASATNLVIGQIIKCDSMAESNHLHICKVDIKDEILDIVCGAPNARVGLKVIVAKVGAKLPKGEIKKGCLLGHESYGMLCALNELGVDEKYLRKEQIEGIEELPDDAVIGNEDVLSYLGLDDTILDLKLLANRSDCNGLYNVAREIAALFKRKLTLPTYKETANYNETNFKVDSLTTNCDAFTLRIFKDVKVKDSPKWLKDVLRSEGIRSINNIVDIGNYVMLLTGQPVHMYDLDKLPKKELIVKDDINDKVIALDDKEYELISNDLVVTSDNIPVAIGGIMGLKNVEVTTSSKNIALEVASFNGTKVRKTSNRLGLSSDSSSRFVKGINKDNLLEVLKIASYYVFDLCEAKEISNSIIFDKVMDEAKEINCSISYINNRLGTSFDKETIISTLKTLYFEIKEVDEDNFIATVPSFRIDVEGKADLSEEIIRYLGFDNVKSSLPLMETTIGQRSLEDSKIKVIKDYLLNRGLDEILTYTLINDKDNEIFNYLTKDEPFKILNPLTEDHKIIRRNLLSSLLNCIDYNFAHQNRDFKLFEISNIETNKKNEIHLSIGLCGKELNQELYNAKDYNFYDLKGYLINIFKLFNISESRVRYERILNTEEFHPNRSAYVYLDNKLFGVFGELYPTIKSNYSFKKANVLVMELNLSILLNMRSGNNKFKEFSKYPSVSRDYTFINDNNTEYSNVIKEIKKVSSFIKNIELIDIYENAITISVTLEKADASFKNDEISEIDEKIKNLIVNKLNLKMR